MNDETIDRSSDPERLAGANTGQRLNSWKAIANYLNRTVRTAHRWEKQEGLPVHRHLHQKQSTVYAYSNEIDAWWAARKGQTNQQSARNGKRVWFLVGGFAGLILLTLLLLPSNDVPRVDRIANSVAVLPFTSTSDDPQDEKLGAAIADDVLDRLATHDGLAVIGRTSSFPYAGGELDVTAMADRLRVEYLLVGALEHDGGVAGVSVRLLGHDGRQLWSDRLPVSEAELFRSRERIAESVVASVAPQLSRRVAPLPEPDAEAYRYYLDGLYYHHTLLDYPAAARAYEKAIALDPAYIPFRGSLALVNAVLSTRIMHRVDFSTVREMANAALADDSGLAEAHAALGIVAQETGDYAEADRELRLALELDSGQIEAWYWLVRNLRAEGRLVQARDELEKALQQNPEDPALNAELAKIYSGAGNYQLARQLLSRLLEGPEKSPFVYVQLAMLHSEYGYYSSALEVEKEYALRYPGPNSIQAMVATYAHLGMWGRADYWLEQLTRFEKPGEPRVGIRAQYLYLRGRIADIVAMKREFLQRNATDISQLPFHLQETFGGMLILNGEYEEGIAVMEPWFGEAFVVPQMQGGADFALTFGQFLAFAYLQVGREEDAKQLLGQIQSHIDAWRAEGAGQNPNTYVVEARNHSLLDKPAKALVSLRQAINAGWRDPLFEHYHPAWTGLQDNPEYQALIGIASADLQAQRERIAADGIDEDYRAAVRVLLEQSF